MRLSRPYWRRATDRFPKTWTGSFHLELNGVARNLRFTEFRCLQIENPLPEILYFWLVQIFDRTTNGADRCPEDRFTGT